MAQHVLESELRRTMRGWPEYDQGLISFIEPARGSDVGISDCLFTTSLGLVPVELKRGPSVVRELRPAQRAWHRCQLHAGINTYGLTILRNRTVVLFRLALSGGIMSDLKESHVDCWGSPSELRFEALCDRVTHISH